MAMRACAVRPSTGATAALLLRGGVQRRAYHGGKEGRGPWTWGHHQVDSTGQTEWGTMRNQNMWRYKENWWRDNESHMTVLYRKSVMREGFAGEEIALERARAEEVLEQGIAVLPDEHNQEVLMCWDPEKLTYTRPIERSPALLSEIARKRQWIDVYWRIHDAYVEDFRQTTGWNNMVSCPINKEDIARLLWQQTQVRINPAWISYRYTNRPLGVTDLGHTWVWISLPGGTDIAAPRLIYNNQLVKLRLHVKFDSQAPF